MNKPEILNAETLVELHEQLNGFAKHHQNKGGQEAHKLVKALWDESREHPRDGSPYGCYEGFDAACRSILIELHKRFVP